MGIAYQAVGWNRQKRLYDAALATLVGLYLGIFCGVTLWLRPEITPETLLLRALGTAAFGMLHVILAIGPLARLDRRFLPLLYNRRHLGVTMFLLAAAHGGLALFQFHALGNRNPLVSLWTSTTRYASVADFPFQPLGFLALVILFVMAATSHDFWLANLTAPVWKRLHMGVYLAYALLVGHVALGALQEERSPVLALFVVLGAATLIAVHSAAGWRERVLDRELSAAAAEGFVEVCRAEEIPEKRARIACLSGERIAVFRYDGKLSALSNVCQHQNGPLGEGKIVDGCVTCPWHGYQYLPESGASPPPFVERVPTFRLRVVSDRVLVHPQPLPPGTPIEPARVDRAAAEDGEAGEAGVGGAEFFIGWQGVQPPGLARRVRAALTTIALVAVVVAAVGAAAQSEFAVAFFEWQSPRSFTGVVTLEPAPMLWVDRPGEAGDEALRSGYLLVAPGKHGAQELARPWAGQSVRLAGRLIYRGGETMVEVEPGSIASADARGALVAGDLGGLVVPQSFGRVRLRGEIVDSKCHLGVMKPGEGKLHRDCAVRCISGGAPPALVVRRSAGDPVVYLLTGPAGEPLSHELLSFVAEPVEVEGELLGYDDLRVLRTDPRTIRRLERLAPQPSVEGVKGGEDG